MTGASGAFVQHKLFLLVSSTCIAVGTLVPFVVFSRSQGITCALLGLYWFYNEFKVSTEQGGHIGQYKFLWSIRVCLLFLTWDDRLLCKVI